jgi:hypothetical protein
MLENSVLAEFAVTELISSKSSSGGSCGTCGGCTVKRRAGAEEDNALLRKQMAARARGEDKTDDVTEADAQGELDESEMDAGDVAIPGSRSKRRRRRPRQRRPGGDKNVD